eukprot:m.121224 g.121224  ORF g.121224 m.121224 type:complete len:213 (-) comp16197_c0_seq2:297-935(-)
MSSAAATTAQAQLERVRQRAVASCVQWRLCRRRWDVLDAQALQQANAICNTLLQDQFTRSDQHWGALRELSDLREQTHACLSEKVDVACIALDQTLRELGVILSRMRSVAAGLQLLADQACSSSLGPAALLPDGIALPGTSLGQLVEMIHSLVGCFTREYMVRLVVVQELPTCVERNRQLLNLTVWQQQAFLTGTAAASHCIDRVAAGGPEA